MENLRSKAKYIALEILDNISDWHGIKNALDNLDDITRNEMLDDWIEIINKHLLSAETNPFLRVEKNPPFSDDCQKINEAYRSKMDHMRSTHWLHNSFDEFLPIILKRYPNICISTDDEYVTFKITLDEHVLSKNMKHFRLKAITAEDLFNQIMKLEK